MTDDSSETSNRVVHPAHGVGEITGRETLSLGDEQVEVNVIGFARSKLTLRVPTARLATDGIRPLASSEDINKMMGVLGSRSKVRHADQYRIVALCEEKVNTGDLTATAKVVRDLHRSNSVREIPYSVESTFNLALGRLAEEVALVLGISEDEASEQMTARLTDERPSD